MSGKAHISLDKIRDISMEICKYILFKWKRRQADIE
jgi:hypothetical protein